MFWGELNTFEQKYFLSLGMNYNSIYFNSKLTDRFIQSHDYYMENQRTYYLYFDSYRDLSDFYNEYFEKFENDYEHLSISSRLNAGRDNDTIHNVGNCSCTAFHFHCHIHRAFLFHIVENRDYL